MFENMFRDTGEIIMSGRTFGFLRSELIDAVKEVWKYKFTKTLFIGNEKIDVIPAKDDVRIERLYFVPRSVIEA